LLKPPAEKTAILQAKAPWALGGVGDADARTAGNGGAGYGLPGRQQREWRRIQRRTIVLAGDD
jgi:hypothetical protein